MEVFAGICDDCMLEFQLTACADGLAQSRPRCSKTPTWTREFHVCTQAQRWIPTCQTGRSGNLHASSG
eukprot:6474569-Amphidinium_carterae.1